MADSCGVVCCHPRWLQRFANTRWFMIIYGLLGTIQATSYLYFVVTLTTIERRIKIPSQTTGIILSGNEISQILLSLILSYAGGQRDRPRWIAWGVVFCALSCFILAWPHFIYGAGEEALQYTQEYLSLDQNVTLDLMSKPVPTKVKSKLCQSSNVPDHCDEVFSYLPLVLIFLSQFVLGIGNTLYYALGQSYLDDNTHQKNTPLMLAYAFSMRMFGPVLGFGLAYGALNVYIDPTLTPLISKDDPRWLGAWWLGWILLGGLMFMFAIFIGMFPKNLPKKQKKQAAIDQEKCNRVFEVTGDSDHNKDADLKNFPQAIMRLLKNKLIMYNNVSTIFYILGASGFITFMSRVMEVQFNRTSAGGSIVTGPITIMGMVIGLLISGYVITKLKPPPKYLFFWNVIVGLASMCGAIAYSNLGCKGGNTLMLNGSLRSCNSDCFCDGVSYSPVCDLLTKETFFSPCHAGCREFDEKLNVYKNCVCTESSLINDILLSTSTMSPVIMTDIFNRTFLSTQIPINISTDKIGASNQVKPSPDERRITLYDVYDEDLKSGQATHDHDETIDANELYDEAEVYDDSQEQLLTTDEDDEEIETSATIQRRHIADVERVVNPGSCFGDCSSAYYTFTFISLCTSLLSSTGRIGNVLINFRAVEPRDKSISQGLSLFLVSLFALIPGPIIFGRIIDSTCLSWSYKCGERGNCQLYDPIMFRYLLHVVAACFIFVGVFFDLLVWYYGRDLELYGDEDEKTVDHIDDSPENEPLNK